MSASIAIRFIQIEIVKFAEIVDIVDIELIVMSTSIVIEFTQYCSIVEIVVEIAEIVDMKWRVIDISLGAAGVRILL